MATPSTTTYRELRASYDDAFRQLARELQRLNLLQICEDVASRPLAEARQRLSAAQSCYLETRNALASHLLVRRSEKRLANAAPLTNNFVEERAYLFRENASGKLRAKAAERMKVTSFARKRDVPRIGSPDPCVSC